MAESNENNTVSDEQEQLATYDEANSESDIGFYQELFAQFKKGLQIAMPAVVEKVVVDTTENYAYGGTLCAWVRPLAQRAVKTAEGIKYVDRPLYFVPIVAFGTGGTTLVASVKAGSLGILFACDRNSKTAISENSAFTEDGTTWNFSDWSDSGFIEYRDGGIYRDGKKVSDSTNKGPLPPDDYDICSFTNGFFLPCAIGPTGARNKNTDGGHEYGGYFGAGSQGGMSIEAWRVLGQGTSNERRAVSSRVNVTNGRVRMEGDSIKEEGKQIYIQVPGGLDRALFDDPKNEYNGGTAWIWMESHRDDDTGNKYSFVNINSDGDKENGGDISLLSRGVISLTSNAHADENGDIIIDRDGNIPTGVNVAGIIGANDGIDTRVIYGEPIFTTGGKRRPRGIAEYNKIGQKKMRFVTDIKKSGNSLHVTYWEGIVYAQKEASTYSSTIPL